jgi:hypothetical protein
MHDVLSNVAGLAYGIDGGLEGFRGGGGSNGLVLCGISDCHVEKEEGNILIRISFLSPFFLFCKIGDVEKAEHCVRLGSDNCHWHVRRDGVLGIIDEHDDDRPARNDGVLQRNFMVDADGLSMVLRNRRDKLAGCRRVALVALKGIKTGLNTFSS